MQDITLRVNLPLSSVFHNLAHLQEERPVQRVPAVKETPAVRLLSFYLYSADLLFIVFVCSVSCIVLCISIGAVCLLNIVQGK